MPVGGAGREGLLPEHGPVALSRPSMRLRPAARLVRTMTLASAMVDLPRDARLHFPTQWALAPCSRSLGNKHVIDGGGARWTVALAVSSGEPDVRTCGYPNCRLSGFPEFRNCRHFRVAGPAASLRLMRSGVTSGSPVFRLSGYADIRLAGIPGLRRDPRAVGRDKFAP